MQPDYAARGLELARADFIKAFRYPFLVSMGRTVVQPAGPQRTGLIDRVDEPEVTLEGNEGIAPIGGPPLVLAIRKVQATFPAMITVGRTGNNDVVIRDVTVSRFHAFFHLGPGTIEVSDAGSRNGTWVNKEKLEPKGKAQGVAIGASIRFGSVVFQFVDAGGCWDFLHRKR
jgi:hypothetical protein